MSPNQDTIDTAHLMAIVGSKLREARNSLNLTQEEVASQLGIGRPRYSDIENGKKAFSVDELYKFSKLFNRHASYFLSSVDSEAEPFLVLFRAVQSDTETSKAVSHFQQLCKNLEFLKSLLEIEYLKKELTPDYEYEPLRYKYWAKHYAECERRQLEIGHEPLKNLYDILEEKRNLSIFRLSLRDDISGMFTYSKKYGGCVLINAKDTSGRQLFSLAHEYGHYLFHKKKMGCVTYSEGAQGRDEKFVDRFAQELLMPEHLILEMYETKFRHKQPLSAEDIIYLSDYFGVSFSAMAWRMRYLTIISEQELNKMLKETIVSRVRDAMGLNEAIEQHGKFPRLYKYLCVKAYINKKITTSKLAELLEIPLYKAMEVAKEIKAQ